MYDFALFGMIMIIIFIVVGAALYFIFQMDFLMEMGEGISSFWGMVLFMMGFAFLVLLVYLIIRICEGVITLPWVLGILAVLIIPYLLLKQPYCKSDGSIYASLGKFGITMVLLLTIGCAYAYGIAREYRIQYRKDNAVKCVVSDISGKKGHITTYDTVAGTGGDMHVTVTECRDIMEYTLHLNNRTSVDGGYVKINRGRIPPCKYNIGDTVYVFRRKIVEKP